MRGIIDLLQIPWLDKALTSVPGQLREKVPALLALRYHVVPLQHENSTIWLGLYDPFDLLARQTLAASLREKVRYQMSTRTLILQALRQGYGIGAGTFEATLQGRTKQKGNPMLNQRTN